MTGAEVIEEIKRLPRNEQAKVFAYAHTAAAGQLTPEELGKLAQQMVEAPTQAEADRLQRQIIDGFYGRAPHA